MTRGLVLLSLLVGGQAEADLPTGYLVWTKGDQGSRASRKIHRMTLPEKTDVRPLTSGEDVEGQISPGGKWVAFAKAKQPDSSYLTFNAWKLYVVSIHGIGEGREETKVDDNGYWPSWGDDNTLYYSQVDPANSDHTRIMKAKLDEGGNVLEKVVFFETRSAFSDIPKVGEIFVARDASWFVGRSRGNSAVAGVGAFTIDPPSFRLLAKAGSVGCQPFIAPSSTWGFIAGREHGILWGDAPSVAGGKTNQTLITPRSGELAYHPGISSDEAWMLAAHSADEDHNAGDYPLYIYQLDGKSVSNEQVLATGGFNGWPTIWVGEPTDPPPPTPRVDSFFPSSYTILRQETVALTWNTSFATEVTLDGAAVAIDGTKTATPGATHTFALVAGSTLSDTTDEERLEVTVHDSPQPVRIVSFTVDPTEVVLGNSAVLSWQTENPYTLRLGDDQVTPSGTKEVSPIETTTYTLTVEGHQGPASQQVTLTVAPLNPLLPDRGGCLCGPSRAPGSLFLFGLVLLGFWFRKMKKTRRVQ